MIEFAVECPHCKKEAWVGVDDPRFYKKGMLICKNCMHAERITHRQRYNAIVKRNCDECGKRIEIIIPNQREKVVKITLPCPACGTTRTYEPTHEVITHRYNELKPAHDPIFHLPLWLQANVKGNVFWAYNRKHLQEIKRYVNAKLRERTTSIGMTMVERLPQFIKEAKNREALLKTIERLERK